MPADHQRRNGVELDAVDRGQQRDDRERMRDEVRDDADIGRGSGQRLLLEDLDPDLLHVVKKVAQRALLGEQHLQQPHLELEVVVVGGHDLDAARGVVEELPIFLWR